MFLCAKVNIAVISTAWNAHGAARLAAVVLHCVERERHRCVVADVVIEVDEFAGRGARHKGGSGSISRWGIGFM